MESSRVDPYLHKYHIIRLFEIIRCILKTNYWERSNPFFKGFDRLFKCNTIAYYFLY